MGCTRDVYRAWAHTQCIHVLRHITFETRELGHVPWWGSNTFHLRVVFSLPIPKQKHCQSNKDKAKKARS